MDDSELKYYYPPNLEDPAACDLSSGYPERYLQRGAGDDGGGGGGAENLDSLLECLKVVNQERANLGAGKPYKPKICTCEYHHYYLTIQILVFKTSWWLALSE
jgi:hypothetical protein